MKNIVYILVCASVIFFTACSSQDKNKKDGTQVLMQDSTEIAGPQRMQVSDVKTSFTYKGKEYQSSVVRRPDESLPIVKNEQGEKFVDNRITLRITCGGKQVVDKVFTKDNFASLVDAKFMKYSFTIRSVMRSARTFGSGILSLWRACCAIAMPPIRKATIHIRTILFIIFLFF